MTVEHEADNEDPKIAEIMPLLPRLRSPPGPDASTSRRCRIAMDPFDIVEGAAETVCAQSDALISAGERLSLLIHSPGISNRHLAPSGAKES